MDFNYKVDIIAIIIGGMFNNSNYSIMTRLVNSILVQANLSLHTF
jgi:hypothetical protein